MTGTRVHNKSMMPATFFDTASHRWHQYAQPWLARLDAGRHAECWHAATDSLQCAMSLSDWQAALQSLPPRQLRQLFACQYYPQLPDGSAAAGWVYQCLSGQDDHERWQETLTLQQQGDGSWRVAGYFVSTANEQPGSLG
jgi:hypothetical protein